MIPIHRRSPRARPGLPSVAWCVALSAGLFALSPAASGAIRFDDVFAPVERSCAAMETAHRSEISLNGLWSFQPVEAASGAARGAPAEPTEDGWDPVPIRIPSPWNVNAFVRGDGGDFRCYPSYPSSWETARAGWVRRSFRIPEQWAGPIAEGDRVVVRFDAILGAARIRVNGIECGGCFDGFLPYECDVTSALRPGHENEIRVGIRRPDLLNVRGKRGRMTYPSGSFWGTRMAGIWQDVRLARVPATRITDVFVRPDPESDRLEVDLRMVADRSQRIVASAEVIPWIDPGPHAAMEEFLAGGRFAPDPVVDFDPVAAVAEPDDGDGSMITLTTHPGDALRRWTPADPVLYGLVVAVTVDGIEIDRRCVRFGWRSVALGAGPRGPALLLNGEPIELRGDSWHFMGIPQMTPRYAWAWYRMLRDAHANAVRLHAQPFPEFYLDVADRMGILVLDETAIWGSHLALNYEPEITWTRFAEHVGRLVVRDRNHPSVFGWSVGNEVRAALRAAGAGEPEVRSVCDRFADLADIVRACDPTRPWISVDGDEDLFGRLPVTMLHYGDHGLYERTAALGKPWGVGEATAAYYGTPRQTATWNGDRSYEDVEGRMEGVAIEAYDLLAHGQRARGAAFCSIFNLAWYGLKPLPLGQPNPAQPPTDGDGILFGPYRSGVAGAQPERLGPYCTTLNPGYDPSLPLYQPWPLFHAVRSAFVPAGPAPCRWDHRPPPSPPSVGEIAPKDGRAVRYAGDPAGPLAGVLHRSGIDAATATGPAEDTGPILVVDAGSIADKDVERLRRPWAETLGGGGAVLLWGLDPRSAARLQGLLPAPVEVIERRACSLVHGEPDSLLDDLPAADLYFCESPGNRRIMDYALTGPLIDAGMTVLAPCPADWERWNHRGEDLKTAAVLRSERESPQRTAALVEVPVGGGRLVLCNLDASALTDRHVRLVRALFRDLDAELGVVPPVAGPLFDGSAALTRALGLGPVPAASHEDALRRDLLGGESDAVAAAAAEIHGLRWREIHAGDGGLFDLRSELSGGSANNCAGYVAFYLYAPRPTDELLAAPGVPVVRLLAGSDDGCRVWLNGTLLYEDTGVHPIPDTLHPIRLPLRRGWNRVLVKVAQGDGRWETILRLHAEPPAFLAELDSALAPR